MVCSPFPGFLLCSGYRLGALRENRAWIMGPIAKEEKQDFGSQTNVHFKIPVFVFFQLCDLQQVS